MKTIIMAGGEGTRIASVNADVPKPMIPVMNKPVLEYQIENLRDQGYTDITIMTGHLGNVIMEYFKDGTGLSPVTGKPFGVDITYMNEQEPLGTAGGLYLLKDSLKTDFLLLNGDIIFDIDVKRFYDYHKRQGGLATLLIHPNDHPYDSGIIELDENSLVTGWLHKEEKRKWYHNRVNAGLHMLSAEILDHIIELKKTDLDRDILKPLIPLGLLRAYDSSEYVRDMGTPERLNMVARDLQKGMVKSKNLRCKQRAVFLDRDGTINTSVGFLRNEDQFNLIQGTAEAIKMINQSGYLTIVVTNQPVIARGEVTIEELRKIHMKMETLLGREGAYVNAVYVCPHHPHKGFKGEITQLKIECCCRKPKPGLLLQAAEEYNIDLENSWMIGDSNNDVEAGMNAGCKVASIGEKVHNAWQYGSLLEFTKEIFHTN